MNRFFRTNSLIDEVSATTKKRRFFTVALIFLLVYMIGNLVASTLLSFPIASVVMNDPEIAELMNSNLSSAELSERLNEVMLRVSENLPDWLTAASLYATVATIVATLFYCLKLEKRRAFTLGFIKKGAVIEYACGLGIGLLLFSAAYGISLLSGELTFNGFNYEASIGSILFFFFGFIIQGASEEILIRSYFFVSTAANSNVLLAILSSSGLFAALHLGNPGISFLAIINLFLFGIFAAIYFLRRGSIWGICAIHSIWNFAQGNIFGCRVSGLPIDSALFVTTENGRTLWSGGAFGPEGGLGVTVVLLIAIGIVTFMKNKERDGFYLRKAADAKSMFY